jgi:hypothetical protein
MDDINPEDLISQLKTLPADSKKLERVAAQHPEISREDLEDFVNKQSSKLIQDSSPDERQYERSCTTLT